MEQDRVGQRLSNYLLLEILGTGGSATVYLGEHIYLKSLAAIKVLKTLPQIDNAHDSFLKEARIIARLTHPHIIRVIECGVDLEVSHSIPYIVMSYASKGNVRKKYPKGIMLPIEVILSFANQAAEALQYVHDQDIVHCDIKPENILIGDTGQILLGDFGIANVSHTVYANTTQTNIHLDSTVSSNIQGTVTYMAPERFEGLINPSSDQYSLAVVVYEWLVGNPPFVGSQDNVIYQHLTVLPPMLSTRNSQISPEIEQVVLKALEKQPDQRYTTIKEFVTALGQAILTSPSYTILSTHQTSTSTVVESPARELLASLPTATNLFNPILLPTEAAPLPAQTQEESTIILPFLPEVDTSRSEAIDIHDLNITLHDTAGYNNYFPTGSWTEEENTGWFFDLIIVLRNIVAIDQDFASLQEFRNFRRFGWLTNGLCVIFFGLVAQSEAAFLIGILTLSAFWLCIRLVKQFMAITVGLAIAGYWAAFGFFLAKSLLTYALFSTLSLPLWIGGFFFFISAALHIYYITHRLY